VVEISPGISFQEAQRVTVNEKALSRILTAISTLSHFVDVSVMISSTVPIIDARDTVKESIGERKHLPDEECKADRSQDSVQSRK
jgi:hypothetical protein